MNLMNLFQGFSYVEQSSLLGYFHICDTKVDALLALEEIANLKHVIDQLRFEFRMLLLVF